ncbi:MAG: efflux RND transporter permease subunit [Betaproteobacteria bacterium]|nr:efflux RND transporter permease subunit [Betaproteobacteria bacterium]
MIESIIRSALQQRAIVIVVAVILLFFGLDAATKLSVDAFPDVTNVQVQIATEAVGRSPQEVERAVTIPVEIAMTGLPGLTEMRSLNRPALSLITLVFTDKTDLYLARQLVMERLIEVRDRLPDDVTPVLGPVSSVLGEVYQYTLEHPKDGNRALTQEELTHRRTIQDWVVRPYLRSIPGVAEINSTGGYVKQYQVQVDPDRLTHFNIPVNAVYDALRNNNSNFGGGIMPHHADQYLIRGVGLIRTMDDIRSIVLKEVNGTPVLIRDVADVRIWHLPRVGTMVKNGNTEAAGGIVMMIASGNAKDVVSRVKARVTELNSTGAIPDGLQIVPYYDRSELVDAALATVVKVLIEGVVLVVVVLFLFLGDVRSSVIVVVTLVLTPLVTFIVMNQVGLSANLMSLGGMAIAIGLMVDGSVVVVENAFSHLGRRSDGYVSRSAVILGSVLEVATPVLFGVGIIILVFLPLMTLTGMEGKMFSPLAYTIAIALGVSLVLSLTLSPALAAIFLKGGADHDTRLIALIKKPYLGLLHNTMNNPVLTTGIAVALFVGAFALVPFLGTSFIPEMKEGSVSPNIMRAPNISIEESTRMEQEAMRRMMEVPGVKLAVSRVGRGESPADPAGPNEADPIVTLKPRDEWPSGWLQDDIAEAIRQKLEGLPGVQIVMAQPISDRVDEMVTGVRSDVAVKIFGTDMDELRRYAEQVAAVASGIRGARDFRIERVSGQQYLQLIVDRQAISRFGLNVSDVRDFIEITLGGRVATEIFEGERRFPASVRLPLDFRNDVADIEETLMLTSGHARVRMKDVARIVVEEGPAQISRETGRRRIVVGMNVAGRDLGGFVAELQEKVRSSLPLAPGYSFEWGGQFQNMEKALKHLTLIVPITIGAIFFLLFLLFRSLRYATLIITVLPFASIGGVVGLFITGEYLSVPASVGFIALWGIAVLNGVVLVSYIESLRQAGHTTQEAIVEGARMRLRPVLMTATVAMLGLIPFLFATGPGSEVQRPLAIVVIGGLLTSTLLTLVVLPTIYPWFVPKARGNDND